MTQTLILGDDASGQQVENLRILQRKQRFECVFLILTRRIKIAIQVAHQHDIEFKHSAPTVPFEL
jgi:hypothetical protein